MMNATLLENPDRTVCPSRREGELSALVERVLGEVSQLRGEVAELRQQVGYWKGMFEQAKRKNEKLQKEIDLLRAENRQLKDRLFAAKSEKKPAKDRSNELDDPKTAKEPRRPRGQQPDTPGPQRRDHSHLPAVEEEVELPSDETACPKCGKPAAEMNETEDSEVIEVEVRAHRLAARHNDRRPYHLNRQRLLHELETPQFALYDAALREAIEAMHQQATEELVQPKLRKPYRKALASLLDHWSGLTLFVDDPRIPMDNNASERMVRGPAMGRKNYHGSGSLWSVCLTAAMFSIVATLKQWNVNPRRWLSWYLESCAATGSRVPEDVQRFLPWNLTADRRAELTSPEASVPINDSS